jgi:hypothetical protein
MTIFKNVMARQIDSPAHIKKATKLLIEFIEVIKTTDFVISDPSVAEEVIIEIAKLHFKTKNVSDNQFHYMQKEVIWRLKMFIKNITLTEQNRYFLKTGYNSKEQELKSILEIELDSDDVAEIIGISRQRVNSLAKIGAIKKNEFSTERKLYFNIKDVLDFLYKNQNYPKKHQELQDKIDKGAKEFTKFIIAKRDKKTGFKPKLY